mgnify:CR=1 FL=1
MINIILSDLFFNYQHTAFDTLYLENDGDEVTQEQIKEAITEDADAFYEAYTDICNCHGCNTGEELADNFLQRL